MKKTSWITILALVLMLIVVDVAISGQRLITLSVTNYESDDRKFVELCRNGTLEEIKEAIKNGANVNAALIGIPHLSEINDEGYFEPVKGINAEQIPGRLESEIAVTALMQACTYNPDIEVIVTLLESGAYINATNYSEDTPLLGAAQMNNNAGIVELLLKNGADIHKNDNEGWTVLHHAAQNQNPAILSLLLKYEINPQIRNLAGNRAIDVARQNKDLIGTEAFKQLEELSRIEVIR